MKLKDACSLEGLPLQVDKESVCNVGDSCLIPGLERSPGGGNGNPLQYSCLENAMDRGAWQATVHGVSLVGHDLATKPLPRWKESYDKPRQHIVSYKLVLACQLQIGACQEHLPGTAQ